MKTRFKHVLLILLCPFFLFSCQYEKKLTSEGIPVISLPDAGKYGKISLADEISRVEYIPLETTEESRMGSIRDICITNDYIYILPESGSDGVNLFDRSGRFIKKFGTPGRIPGRNQKILNITVEEEEGIFYASQLRSTLCYTLDGSFIKTSNKYIPAAIQYMRKRNILPKAGLEYNPLNEPCISERTDVISLEESSDLSEEELLNRVRHQVYMVYSGEGILTQRDYIDTIFRMTSNAVYPAYYIETWKNKKAKNSSYNPENIHSYGFFETPKRLFLRFSKMDDLFIFSYDKATGKTKVEKNPINLKEAFDPESQHFHTVGIKNKEFGGLPIWICKSYPKKKLLVQYLTFDEICFLTDRLKVHAPQEITPRIHKDSNPVLILYHLK